MSFLRQIRYMFLNCNGLLVSDSGVKQVGARRASKGHSVVVSETISMQKCADSCQLALFIWRCFVVRTLCATTSLFTNVSCAWRTLRGPCGLWTRWSSTRGGLSGALRARWLNQSSGTSSRPAIKTFPFVHCVFCDFLYLFLISFYIFLYIISIF